MPHSLPSLPSLPERLPTLDGAGVVLRAFRDTDVAPVLEVASDPLVPLVTTVPAVPDEGAALAYVRRQQARRARGEGFSFAVARAVDDSAVGQIGLWLRDLEFGRASVGYWIAPSARRQGFARAALLVLSEWGLTLPGVARLELYVEPWNEGSWRAAEAAGYRREGLLRSWRAIGDERCDVYVYGRVASEEPAGGRAGESPGVSPA